MPSDLQTAVSIVQAFGPFGLAAAAVWWLTSQHGKNIAAITAAHESSIRTVADAHERGLEKLSASIEKIGHALERKDAVEREQIKATAEVAIQMARLLSAVGEMSSRLMSVEKAVSK